MVLKGKCERCHAPHEPIFMKIWNGNGFDCICKKCSENIMECACAGIVIKNDMPDVYHQILGETIEKSR